MTSPAPNTGFLDALGEIGYTYLALTAVVWAGCYSVRAPLKRYAGAMVLGAFLLLAGTLVIGLLSIVLPNLLAGILGVIATLTVAFLSGRQDIGHAATQWRRGASVDAINSRRERTGGPERPGWLVLAGWPIPPSDETKHFKMIGTTGTGKSTAIRAVLSGALARGDRAIIADAAGAYLERFYDPDRGDIILNPFDARSKRWDLAAELQAPYDFAELARSLIPDGDGEHRIWRQYGQIFLAAMLERALVIGAKDVGEIYRLLTAAPLEELQILLEGTPAQPFVASSNQKMFASIRTVTTSSVGALEYIRRQSAELFSVRRWVREGRGVLFLPYSASQISALRSVISSWMRIGIFETMNMAEGDARLWFVVDELDALGPIDGLKDALPRLRKFGGRCVLGFQSIAQISVTYGHGDADTMVENCGNTLILRCSASEGGGTASFASKLIGEREIMRESISRTSHPGQWFSSNTRSEQTVIESAVLASEIEQLADFTGFLKLASSPTWRRVRLDARDRPMRKGGTI